MGISYINSPSALDVCKNKTDPECYENSSKPKWQIVDALGKNTLKDEGFIVNTESLFWDIFYVCKYI